MEKVYLEELIEYTHMEVNEVIPLEGGLTNKTYLLMTDLGKFVLRVPGTGTNDYINRKDEIRNLELVQQMSFAPELIYKNENNGLLCMKYFSYKEELTSEVVFEKGFYKEIAETLCELHSSDIKFDNEFDIRENIDMYINQIRTMGRELPEEVNSVIEMGNQVLEYLFEKYPKRLVPCHVDPKFSNFLSNGECMILIDWEYSGMADKYFELVNVALTNQLDEKCEKIFLDEYFRVCGEEFVLENIYCTKWPQIISGVSGIESSIIKVRI